MTSTVSEKNPACGGSRRNLGFWCLDVAPALFYMAIIFSLGTDRASAGETHTLLERILGFLAPGLLRSWGYEELEIANNIFRKLCHFGGYGLLGFLYARIAHTLRAGVWRPGDVYRIWLCAAVWAAVDEYHQSFSPSRGGSAYDVALDSAGAGAVILLFIWSTHRWQTQRNLSNQI